MRRNKVSIILIIAFLGLFPGKIFSQQEGEGVYRIIAITTEGNKNYDSKIIIANSGLKVGTEITIPSEDTRDAISRLWNLGLFSDVQIVVDKKVGTDVYLVIRVKELPKLESIKFEGNEEFSEKDLNDKIPLAKQQVITPQTIKDIEYNIKKAYIDEGYPLAKVSVDELINSFNEAQLRVKITEGSKISVRHIIFEGNKNVSHSELAGAMDETTEETWWKFWDNARFNKDKYEGDKKLVIDRYRELGYKDATLLGDTFIYSPDKSEMDIRMKVIEGNRFRIRNIVFKGNKIYKDSLLYDRLGMKKGDIYNYKKFNQNLRGNETQTDVASLYLDNGYLNLNIDVDEKPVDDHTVDLTININENKQFRIGLINFTGNVKTQDKVIRRELYTLPGLYFNKTDMIRSMQAIRALNYFDPEKLNYDFSQKNDTTVDLTYTLEEKSSDQLNASIGWSESFGLSGTLGLVFNNFDIADPFSGGAGQIFSIQWDFGTGGTYQQFSLGFTEPWLWNKPTSAGINLFDTRTDYVYSLRETGVTMSLGRRFRFPDPYFRGDWFLKTERTEVVNGAGIYQNGVRTQVSIGQTISRNSTDNPIFPTVGSKISLGVELAGLNLIGNISFHKETFQAEAFNSIDNHGKFILYSNMLFQTINSISKDGYIPPTEYLFMGGSGLAYNTVALRGYEDRSVGPAVNQGTAQSNPIGGNVLLKYGVELRYSVIQDPIPIYLSLFGEAGNVWANFHKADIFDLRRSVGFGVRLMLPAVGIIGFDLGYGFDRKLVDGQDPSWVFHFQFGKAF